LDKLLKEKSITLIYCDSLKKGNELSKRYNTEFIYSGTKKRLEIVQETLDKKGFVVLSRVGDEGVSLPTVQRIIEFDFLYGSRRQESQRIGRLFHSLEQGEHYILMTIDEFNLYKKRLYSLLEKGIEVEVENKVIS
jgi:DNA excision repair protein ERCC-3